MEQILLENEVVMLKPVTLDDVVGFGEAANHPDIWRFLSTELLTEEAVRGFIEKAIRNYETGSDYMFAIINKASGKIVGSTSFMDISHEHKRLEIGWTWHNPSVWQTAINTNCKYLLLKFCFEEWDMHRVQIKTDHENYRSQRAIERLGAVKEGVLRNHMIRKDGTQRHTVMYSITREEWPSIKGHFEQKLL